MAQPKPKERLKILRQTQFVNIQIPFYTDGDNFTGYFKLVDKASFKIWLKPCPLCGAEGCAKFLQFYSRVRVYFDDTVYDHVKIARFICNRLNPNVAAGTHRTFSLLPYPLVPYSPFCT